MTLCAHESCHKYFVMACAVGGSLDLAHQRFRVAVLTAALWQATNKLGVRLNSEVPVSSYIEHLFGDPAFRIGIVLVLYRCSFDLSLRIAMHYSISTTSISFNGSLV